MPRKADQERPIKYSQCDPYLILALQVIKQAVFDKDLFFFRSVKTMTSGWAMYRLAYLVNFWAGRYPKG